MSRQKGDIMKDVLISLKPYYYYLIGEGIKKVEVRKSYPKAEDWSRNSWFYMSRDEKSFAKIPKEFQEKYRKHFGKVGMRFVCDKIYNLSVALDPIDCSAYFPDGLDHTEGTCLTKEELAIYLCGGKWSGKGYGLNITDLFVYDEPRELSEFAKPAKTAYDDDGYLLCDGCEFANWNIDRVCTIDFCPERMIARAPQSWQFCIATEPRQTAD
jgi:hypothetical protein